MRGKQEMQKKRVKMHVCDEKIIGDIFQNLVIGP